METNIYTGAFLAMCERVLAALQTQAEKLPANSALLRYIVLLLAGIEKIRETEAERKKLEKSPAKQKAFDKQAVEASRAKLAGALLAYASDEKNIALKERARQYNLKENFKTDRDLKTNFDLLVKDARANAKSLEPYSIAEINIADAEALALALPVSMNQTYVARDNRSAKTEIRDNVQAEIRALFRDKLDPAVNALDDSEFVNLYNRLRRIRKSAAHQAEQTSAENATSPGSVSMGTKSADMPPAEEIAAAPVEVSEVSGEAAASSAEN